LELSLKGLFKRPVSVNFRVADNSPGGLARFATQYIIIRKVRGNAGRHAKELPMIQGYPDQPSLFPGETLSFHVSTDASQFRVEFYRHGADLVYQFMSGWMLGIFLPSLPADQDWGVDRIVGGVLFQGWPAYSFDLPGNTQPGVYIAKLVEFPAGPAPVGGQDIFAPTGQMLFVVKNPTPGSQASILYKLPLFTYQAYNSEGGWSLYDTPPDTPVVTIRRPGGGTGGTPWDGSVDPNDPDTPRQTYAHFDAWFVSWLATSGYEVDFCTDLDLDSSDGPGLLGPYRVMLSVGHDEYWTAAMRDHVEGYIGGGGNVAFLSGNISWWQLVFDDPTTISRPFNWYQSNLGPARPENWMTGVSFRNGGYFPGSRAVGFTVQHADHWVFAGTGLSEGDNFGADAEIVGYECDGANFDRGNGPPFQPKGDDGTPAEFLILGIGDIAAETGLEPGQANGNLVATMGVYVRNGTVFTAATTDWARVVAKNNEANTVQITRNVLRRLGGFETVDVTTITGRSVVTAATSWQTMNGPFNVEHLAAADANGHLLVFWWSPQHDWQVVDVTAITGRSVVTAATSWQTMNGLFNVEHLAASDANGHLLVFGWSPQHDWQAVDVTGIVGTDFRLQPTSWQRMDISERLAAIDDEGNIWIASWSARHDWCATNISAITEQSLITSLTNWTTWNGPSVVEHIAGVNSQRHLLVIYWE
jgi:hypothetical protein